MSSSGDAPTGLVADADVLIDYTEADRSVLALISRHVAAIRVPSPVLEEVRQLSEGDVAVLGIVVVEPTLAQVLEAQVGEGTTSFQDRLCFVMARAEGWGVLTNDAALRKACHDVGLLCVWGIEAMGLLVEAKHLSAQRAMAAAQRIAHVNPFITDRILQRFRSRLGL